MTQEQRHPRSIAQADEDAARKLISEGEHDSAVSKALGIDRRTSARIRRDMGMPPKRSAIPLDVKLRRDWRPREDGHTGWDGRRYSSGGPSVRKHGQDTPATHVAFKLRTGRYPVGIVKTECGERECLTPAHLSDEIERRTVRMQERALLGMVPQPWDVCPAGTHRWDEDGRLEPNLKPYCKSCNTERAAKSRAILKAGQAPS